MMMIWGQTSARTRMRTAVTGREDSTSSSLASASLSAWATYGDSLTCATRTEEVSVRYSFRVWPMRFQFLPRYFERPPF